VTPTISVTPTTSVTNTPTTTVTATLTLTPTATLTQTVTKTTSVTPTPTASVTPTRTVTPTATPTPTITPTATLINILVAAGVVELEISSALNGGITTYSISQFGTLNPTLTCYRGTNYDFIIKTPSYPFALRTAAGNTSTSVNGAYNNNLVSGGTGGIIMFTPNDTTPNTIVYQCSSDPTMIGTITIRNY